MSEQDWKCPKCGHVLGTINLVAPAAAAAAQTTTVTQTLCGSCGKPLPPTNTTAAHQCWGTFR